jgi:hypothetical protein
MVLRISAQLFMLRPFASGIVCAESSMNLVPLFIAQAIGSLPLLSAVLTNNRSKNNVAKYTIKFGMVLCTVEIDWFSVSFVVTFATH